MFEVSLYLPPSKRLLALTKPIYLGCMNGACLSPRSSGEFLEKLHIVLQEGTRDDVNDLLREPNWRTRIVGAYLAAFKRWNEFEETIGRLLVKDELIFASVGYCFALSSFASPQSAVYLCSYLYNNYAGRCTDMSSIAYAVGCVKYLDERMNTSCFDENLERWHQKIAERSHGFSPNNKPHDDVSKARDYLRKTLDVGEIEKRTLWARQMNSCIAKYNEQPQFPA